MLVLDLITTDQDQKFAPAGRLATHMVGLLQEKGCWTYSDLIERGCTHDEIIQHGAMAEALANVEINLLCDHPTKLQSIIRRRP